MYLSGRLYLDCRYSFLERGARVDRKRLGKFIIVRYKNNVEGNQARNGSPILITTS